MSNKHFVGFGFGAIQTCLMLLEAQKSGNFSSFTVAEVNSQLVKAIRKNKGRVSLNIATQSGIKKVALEDIRVLNPNCVDDRKELARAIFHADEMATAVPNVACYAAGHSNSIASLLAENINNQKQQILYACENHNYAAERLSKLILSKTKKDALRRFQAVNTVIGKMCGVLHAGETSGKLALQAMVPESERFLLCEEFNRILISKIALPGFVRGIAVFEEKEDLLPYEEAKLYGHNAVHSLLGYLAHTKGYHSMAQIRQDFDLYTRAREAFLTESGASLVKKYAKIDESQFSRQGFRVYADDLLRRMLNPYLSDDVARICRDPARKLGYNDRFFGAMRQTLKQGIRPFYLAQAAFAALQYYLKSEKRERELAQIHTNPAIIRDFFRNLWQQPVLDYWSDTSVECVIEASLDKA